MTPAYLHERLRYDPETGKLYWRRYEPHPACWNARFAGAEAFTALSTKGYRKGRIDYRRFPAHRVCWALYYGAWPENEIDHEDHDKTNNRVDNLRVVDRTGQNRNTSRARTNTSGVTGVGWHTQQLCWRARININGRLVHLGLFDDFGEAVAVRRAAEAVHGYHPNHGAPQ